MLRTLDLFSGIGGFSLGLESTGGFETIAFCEIDPFCRKVLAKHWPGVPIHDDIHTLSYKDGRLIGGPAADLPPPQAVGYCEYFSVCHDPNRCDDPNDCWLLRHPECEPVDWRKEAGIEEHDDIRTLSDATGPCRVEPENETDARAGSGKGRDGSCGICTDISDAQGVGRRRGRGRRIVVRGADGQPARTLCRGPIDVVCGGFPCQDISTAGAGAGIDGKRSGLWRELARVIGEVRPRYAILENVAALLGRGLDRVLGDLAALGYDAEWHCIPAAAVGAPHRRDRVWIVAYPGGGGRQGVAEPGQQPGQRPEIANRGGAHDVADAECPERRADRAPRRMARELGIQPGDRQESAVRAGGSREDVADPDRARQPQPRGHVEGSGRRAGDGGADLADAEGEFEHRTGLFRQGWRPDPAIGRWWRVEPDVGRVAHGIPMRVDRLRGLGNAVVPQIVEIIGRAILAADAHLSAPPAAPAGPLGAALLDPVAPAGQRPQPSDKEGFHVSITP